MTVVASCVDARFAYPPVRVDGVAVQVFDKLDLSISAGEYVGLIGPNGAGKTTLLLLLAGLAPRFTGGTLKGSITTTGRVGMVFQETEGQLFNPTVEAEIAWGLENLGIPPATITERVDWALDALNIMPLRQKSPGSLSGGQQRRVALATALALQPDILLLDEPSGGLDPEGRSDVLAALADLKRRYEMTVVMAENDADVVADFAERIVVLHNGKVVRDGTPRQIFREVAWLDEIGAPVPPAARLADQLRARWPHLDFVTAAEALIQLRAVVPSAAGQSRDAFPGER